MKEITKGEGEIIPRQDLKSLIAYPKEESNYLETGWDRLELPDNQYDFKERDLSWDYMKVVISQPLVKQVKM